MLGWLSPKAPPCQCPSPAQSRARVDKFKLNPSVPSSLVQQDLPPEAVSAGWHRQGGIHTRPTATGGLCQLLAAGKGEKKKKKRGPRRGQRCLHSLPACRNAAKSITVPPRQEITDASHSLWQEPSAGLKWKLQRRVSLAQRTTTPFSPH